MRRRAVRGAALLGTAAIMATSAACGHGGSHRTTSAFCTKAKQLKDDAVLNNLGNSTDPQANKSGFSRAVQAIKQLEQRSPAQIDGDVKVFQHGIEDFNTEVQRAGGDLSKVDPSKMPSASSDQLTKASGDIAKFAQDKCGVQLS